MLNLFPKPFSPQKNQIVVYVVKCRQVAYKNYAVKLLHHGLTLLAHFKLQ